MMDVPLQFDARTENRGRFAVRQSPFSANRLRVFHQPHKAEVHVQLHVTVIEGEPGIIGDEIDLSALAPRHVHSIFQNARCGFAADAS